MSNQDPLEMHRPRGLSFDDVKEEGSKILDFFGSVDQSNIGDGSVSTDQLPREDQIALLVDGQTPSLFGSSPWSVGKQLDQSVADQIHAQNGGTLVFAISANVFDLAESKISAVRYALVWDDAIKSEVGTLDLNLVGQTFLIVGLHNEPAGRVLTLWITDPDISVTLVKQGSLQDIDKIRSEVIGKIGAAAGTSNPFTDAVNSVTGFLTASQIGGLVGLAVIGVVLVLVVRSESFKDVAAVAAKAV